MAENVPTNGFGVPPIANMQTPAVQPQAATPGFAPMQPIAPLAPAPVVPAPAAPAPTRDTDALAAAVAALTKAMEAKPDVPASIPDAGLNVLDPTTLEDPTLRSMAVAFKALGAGLDFDRAIGKAIDSGDVRMIDVAYLREKAGVNADGLIGLAESIVGFTGQQAQRTQKAVYDTAGGEAQWNAATAAFNQSAPAELKLAISQLVNSGKDANVQAGAKLVVQFAQSKGLVPTPAGLVAANAGMPQGLALSKEEFQAALRQVPLNDRDFEKKRGELYAARQLGKQQGK